MFEVRRAAAVFVGDDADGEGAGEVAVASGVDANGGREAAETAVGIGVKGARELESGRMTGASKLLRSGDREAGA